jgi:uncharacterized protein YidB (DUF937 family)
MHPITLALIGILAYRTYHGKGRLAEWMGRRGADADVAATTGGNATQPVPDVVQSLGAAPLVQGLQVVQGLQDLLKDFQQKGFGETIKTWIEPGTNKPMSSSELEQALGRQKMEWLMEETGLSKAELLEGLSRELPATVDQLTPEGRLPTEQEAEKQIATTKTHATQQPSAA